MGSRRRLQPPGFLPLALAGFSLMASYGIVRPLARALFSFEARFMLWGMAVTPLLVTLLLVEPGQIAHRHQVPVIHPQSQQIGSFGILGMAAA